MLTNHWLLGGVLPTAVFHKDHPLTSEWGSFLSIPIDVRFFPFVIIGCWYFPQQNQSHLIVFNLGLYLFILPPKKSNKKYLTTDGCANKPKDLENCSGSSSADKICSKWHSCMLKSLDASPPPRKGACCEVSVTSTLHVTHKASSEHLKKACP